MIKAQVQKAQTVAERLRLEGRESLGLGIGVLVINYNTAAQTLRCLESIQQSSTPPDWVFVLDNASASADYERLVQHARSPETGTFAIFRSETNLGFAQGSNVLIDLLLQNPECHYVMLLNNDAVAEPAMLALLKEALEKAGDDAGIAGGRMHKLSHPEQVDTLGIALYASLMPADRKTLDDVFLGPTGGCSMLQRKLIERLKTTFGYCFDPRYFCYCEDTDLVIRTVLLGYKPIYLDRLVALHEGQASSGGTYNSFIAYHGLRNAIWMHAKLIPANILLRKCLYLLTAHMFMFARYAVSGNLLLVIKIYRDVLIKMPEFLSERRRLKEYLAEGGPNLGESITKRFYRKGYLLSLLRGGKV
ncbi:glycosyltransferase family 2 protein [Acidovorax sp. Leaf160]|uniref:glycosyltransferase family 2 protein n=1 Tax=Acidovorax sp. Leaf160 TaxID=1736280 RepID=UPI001F3E09E4|nr:glycosyltransferase family 2 protein [Acidovorax sp. Leaf160]